MQSKILFAVLSIAMVVIPASASAQEFGDYDFGGLSPVGSLGDLGGNQGYAAPSSYGSYDYGGLTPVGQLSSPSSYGSYDYGGLTPVGQLNSSSGYGTYDYGGLTPVSELGTGANQGYTAPGTPGYTSTPINENTPGYTSTPIYENTPGYTSTPYSSIPAAAASYIPQSAAQYIPGYASNASYGAAPSFGYAAPVGFGGSSAAPNYASASQSSNNTNTNVIPNTNTNTNSTGPITNTNSTGPSWSSSTSNPTVTSVNTNTPTATATNGAITNNNNSSASTGPITLNNVVNVVPVSHAQPQPLAQYTLPTPSCTIYASAGYSTGYYNQPVTLTWNSSNATSAYITPQLGSVNTSGSQLVYPNGYTTYTMTVSGSGGTATCQATANYGNSVVPTYTQPTYIQPAPYIAPTVYTQPAAPAVSLTQIPYTGFDYGPLGNAIYWMSMLSFAVAAGYLLLYYRGGSLAFAGSLFGRGAAESYDFDEVDESETEVATPTRREEIESVAASITAAPVKEEVIEEAPMVASPIIARALPAVENNRVTIDSMHFDHSSGMPRIVIARS